MQAAMVLRLVMTMASNGLTKRRFLIAPLFGWLVCGPKIGPLLPPSDCRLDQRNVAEPNFLVVGRLPHVAGQFEERV